MYKPEFDINEIASSKKRDLRACLVSLGNLLN